MTLVISDLARAKSMTDLKADKSAKIRGGFLFGVSTTKVNQEIINNTQNAEADNGAIVVQAINGSVNMNFIT